MRKRRRNHNKAIPWLAAIAVIALGIWLLLANVVFVVREVRIVGAGEVPEADVRHLSNIRLGSRMSALDETRVRLDVESDGRVALVSLEKRLPSRVILNVRPRGKDAIVIQGGHILVLDSDAYVVDVAETLPGGQAVYVTGIRSSSYAVGRQLDQADGRCAAMKAVVEALKAQGATGYVSELSVANTADIRVITRAGTTALLGDAGNMEAKVMWMVGALSDLESRGERGGLLDVSSGTKADYRPPEKTEEEARSVEGADAMAAPES